MYLYYTITHPGHCNGIQIRIRRYQKKAWIQIRKKITILICIKSGEGTGTGTYQFQLTLKKKYRILEICPNLDPDPSLFTLYGTSTVTLQIYFSLTIFFLKIFGSVFGIRIRIHQVAENGSKFGSATTTLWHTRRWTIRHLPVDYFSGQWDFGRGRMNLWAHLLVSVLNCHYRSLLLLHIRRSGLWNRRIHLKLKYISLYYRS